MSLRAELKKDEGVRDPLRLCVYATVATLSWVIGPLAGMFFAGLALAGYIAAHRKGLRRSNCKLGDTRLVIAYCAALFALAAGAFVWGIVN